MTQSRLGRTMYILGALLILDCAAFFSHAGVLHHWRFEEEAFLEDAVDGVMLNDVLAFGQQFVDLDPGANEAGKAFPTSFEGIGQNQWAMESQSGAQSLFADGTVPVDDEYTIELLAHVDSYAGNANGIVLAAQYTDCCRPPEFSWTFMIRTDGLFDSDHGELIAWSSNGSRFEFLQSDFVLEEETDYYLAGSLDMSSSEYTFYVKDLTNDLPLQTSTVSPTIRRLNQSSRFWTGGGSGWSLDGLIDEIRFSDHALTVDELLISMTPPNLPGDFNLDGQLTVADVDLLSIAILDPNPDRKFDVTGDEQVDSEDQVYWVKELKKTWFGDANLDGEFNSGDLVDVFQAGEYEDNLSMNSTWASGDWNADGEFDSGDLVSAFQDGGFELEPMPVSSVPEPTAATTLIVGLIGMVIRRR